MGDDSAPLRRKQTSNIDIFKPSDLDDPSDVLRYIPTPEPHMLRKMARNAGRKGELSLSQKQCPHVVSAVDWMVDDLGDRHREGRPTNLFKCRICDATLFLVDGAGKSAADG